MARSKSKPSSRRAFLKQSLAFAAVTSTYSVFSLADLACSTSPSTTLNGGDYFGNYYFGSEYFDTDYLGDYFDYSYFDNYFDNFYFDNYFYFDSYFDFSY